MAARILIVEDEALIAADLADALESQGYTITGVAGTGDLALRLAEEQQPDVVLCDVHLRGRLDGIEVAEKLRPNGAPLVFLTAHGDPTTLARAEAVEPAGYLIKPFDERTLFATLRMALFRAAAERERSQRRAMVASAVERIDRPVLGFTADGHVIWVNSLARDQGSRRGQTIAEAFAALGRPGLAQAVQRAREDESAPTEGFQLERTGEDACVVIVGSTAEVPLCLCAWCQRARGEDAEWVDLEQVLRHRYGLALTHGICHSCVETHFSDFLDEDPL